MSAPGGDITCRELVELVTDYLEGAMAPDERGRFEAHLAVCPGCVEYVRQIREVARIAGRVEEGHLTAAARDELLAAFRGWKRGGGT